MILNFESILFMFSDGPSIVFLKCVDCVDCQDLASWRVLRAELQLAK